MAASCQDATARWKRVWLSWPLFVLVLTFWALCLVLGENLHGFIHVLLFGATMQLVGRIVLHWRT